MDGQKMDPASGAGGQKSDQQSAVSDQLKGHPMITGASVKVMRSYDYCHFEIALSTDQQVHSFEVDLLRKEAMRLADKAVEQYKIAKRVEERKLYAQGRLENLRREVTWISQEIPESELTPEHKAKIKALEDYEFQAQFEYDYEDDWEDFDDFLRD